MDQVLSLQELMVKKPKLSTLKRSSHLNMQQLGEEHNEAMNDAKYNGTTETIE